MRNRDLAADHLRRAEARLRDVADVIEAERDRIPPTLQADIPRLAAASRALRRDRELSFYGAEDLTPSAFYRKADATEARRSARLVVELVRPHLPVSR